MGYKFAFDLGLTSCGWSVVKVDEFQNVISFEDMGVRIFPDGRKYRNPEPLCVERRDKRSLRKRFDRILERKVKVLCLLKENGMMFSSDDERKNPYELRALAVNKRLPLSEFGRILFNLSFRRGFKSNRKEIKKDNKNNSGLSKAMKELDTLLSGKTLGEFLYEKFCKNYKNRGNNNKIEKTRFSEQFDGQKLKDGALYPTREMYEFEFEKIWSKQAEFHSVLTDELKRKFYNAIFYQRPLKPQQLGFCMVEDGEYRIYKAHPLFQKFRVLQTVNQLEVVESGKKQNLTEEQRSKLVDILLKSFDGVSSAKSSRGTISFVEIIKKLKLPKSIKFNIESEKRDKIYADTTAFLMSRDDCFGPLWFKLSLEEQCKIIDMILDDEISEDKIKQCLEAYNLQERQIENILIQPLEEGTGSLSIKAINKVLPYLEKGELYNEACRLAGYHHSFFDGDMKMLSRLPYYGDVLKKSCVCDKNGIYKITNVSVHIALNQLRFIVNELIEKYGNPDSIAIEVARDLKVGTDGLKEINRKQAENKKINDKIIERLKTDLKIEKPSREDILKYKLWENLSKDPNKRLCVYTGRPIKMMDLKEGFVQIEHILPFSRTLDDSIANKTLSFAGANSYKGNKTPYEAFSESKDDYNWDEILERAKNLPANVRWRFEKDAMEKFAKNGGPIARALNDTRYITTMAVSYLKHICKRVSDCYGLPGQMTAFMREIWGLNFYKDKRQDDVYRSSHIHHAIDAFVVACMTRGQLKILADNADNVKVKNKDYSAGKDWQRRMSSDPFDGFDRHEFIKKCESTVISYRPKLKNPKDEKSTIGALHEDTAYSLLDFKRTKKGGLTSQTKALFVCRGLVSDLKEKDLANVCDSYAEKLVRDKVEAKDALSKFLKFCSDKGKKKIKLKKEVDFSNYIPVFRSKQERDAYHTAYENWYVQNGRGDKVKERKLMEILCENAQKAYKWYVGGNNFCADIYQINPEDKVFVKERGTYQVEIISNYMATLFKGEPLWKKKYPKARRVMRLKQDDQIMLEIDGKKCVYRVRGFGLNKQFFLRYNTDTKDTERSFNPCLDELIEKKIRKIYVSPIGEVIDNGFDTKWSNKDDK